MTRRDALIRATATLDPVSDTPRLDAELLLAHALAISREELLLNDLEGDAPSAFAALLKRRLSHEPVAYILGQRDFWTISVEVNPAVLIPRPDSETLIEAAVGYFGEEGPKRILDLGTGSGALLLAALHQWPEASGTGIDSSAAALEVACRNTARIAPGRAVMAPGDWATGLEGRFDLILCNPPYIERTASLPPSVVRHEPVSALFAGHDGLDDYRRIVPALPPLLAAGGMIAMEIGSTQAEAVSALFKHVGLSPEMRCDLGGRPRAILHFGLGIGHEGR